MIKTFENIIKLSIDDKYEFQREVVFDGALIYNTKTRQVSVSFIINHLKDGVVINEKGVNSYSDETSNTANDVIIPTTGEQMTVSEYNTLYGEFGEDGVMNGYKIDTPDAYSTFDYYQMLASTKPIILHDLIKGAIQRWAIRKGELTV
jgi:hypothetical protein